MYAIRGIRTICLLSLIIGFTACGTVEPDQVEKTYPDASELEPVSLHALKETAPAPGAYNIEVYVIEQTICGACCVCIIPDGITVAETRDPDLPDEGLHLAVIEPRQFGIGRQYLISVEVTQEDFDNPITGKPVRRVRLLGYNQAE